ncbi:tellurite resistance protein TerC [Actinokineospora alba]|uniref:Tellurite resistance protein TerC n=1 Tax=Actinokineospora alba TaxID=504798 RepID=A0A1H0WEM4_9PSEU|nr:TerC family protein [Actinokineospora alba]TDP68897.1 tellurite resistance protein TerC [Actinokineospora alba]SDI74466.1 tellurite resistance protein TerC [Actinokineospora alba]SDP88925.1 tellurite resistance protein TerC [Actinokineospora alba]
MAVPAWAWFATIGGLLVLFAIDLLIVDRKPHEVTIGEAGRWVAFYIGCAVAFGGAIWAFSGATYAGEFFAGYITEYSLSVDNLFIFLIIMSAFAVPKIHQHKVLLVGIVIALVMRGIFIAVGAVAIAKFSWVFYLFGLFLIYTAWKLSRQGLGEDEEYEENAMTRFVRRLFPVTDQYHGAKSFTRIDGKRFVTPMFIVMIAIGTADLLFAVDSIPAIFGLTKEPFLVFTANAFALMGLRQLYFLLGGLLRKLVYLSVGLAVILGFIGVKLVLEALHTNTLPFINGGEPLNVPTIGIQVSLSVIVGVLVITTVASLIKSRKTEANESEDDSDLTEPAAQKH